MKLWLSLLIGFFAFAVDNPAADPNPDAGDDPDPQGDLQLNLEGNDPDPADPADDPQPDPKVTAAEERTRAAEARAEQFQRELQEHRTANTRGAPSPSQKLFDAEEVRLRDEKTTDLERWQIEANRKLRSGESSANAALFEARDVSDRTAFRALEVTKPALFKRYEKRVEEELQKVRSQGGNAAREAILRYLIGTDAMEGKLAAKKKPAADAGAQAGIKRGQLPGARSDVRGKSTMSEHEKRRARLENVQI